MSLYTSLFSGVSGLRNHQVMLDVIGNNITNVNTIGFKASRTTFSELFAQTRLSAFRPSGEAGGINPQQIGLGANVASIDAQFTQGNLEASGVATDLGITGGGFFVVNADGRQKFTRVGNFTFDGSGNMVLPSTGAILQGRLAKEDGSIPAETSITNLKLSLDRKAPAKASTLVKLSGNLDSNAPLAVITPPATTPPPGSTVQSTFQVYDSLGNQHSITVTFSKTASNSWGYSAALSSAPTVPIGSGTVAFDSEGKLTNFTTTVPISFDPGNGAATVNITLFDSTMLNKFSGLTQTNGASLVNMRDQDGYASGSLENIAVEKNGRIQGKFSNGVILSLGQILLAEFNNPGGLTRDGESMYSASGNSGSAAYIVPGEGSTSEITGGALESSNVDLAEEFTRMIIAQRGYQ